MRPPHRLRSLTGVVTLSAVVVGAWPGPALAASDPGRRGFVVSNIYVASLSEEDACSELSLSTEEIYLKSLPADEARRLADPANARELRDRLFADHGFKNVRTGKSPGPRGENAQFTEGELAKLRRDAGIPAGKGALSFLGQFLVYSVCTDPFDFSLFATGSAPYRSSRAYGIDLDSNPETGGFSSPDQVPGVDNALISAVGCERTTRDYGNPDVASRVLSSLASPTLIEVSGIDDPVNDEAVTVRFFASFDPLEVGADGRALPYATYDADPDRAFQAHTRGRIENGMVITEAFDLKVRVREQIIDGSREIRRAQVRFPLAPENGVSDGGIYGYHTVATLAELYAQSGITGLSLMSCAGAMKAIDAHADADPDPRTGKNTTISSALFFHAVPAFPILAAQEER